MTPDQLLVSYYDYRLVALSVLLAILGAYCTIDLAGRVTATYGNARLAWLTGGAAAMGVGTWSMHYTAMLAFHLPVPIQYDWPLALLSYLHSFFASAVGLFAVSRQKMGQFRALAASLFMGGGISSLHYIAMESMRLPAMCHYSPSLVALSVLIAIAFSLMSLRLMFFFRNEAPLRRLGKIASALVLGAAISVMHYTGMAAASFTRSATVPDLSHALSISFLGTIGIVIVTMMVFGIVLLTSLVDRLQEQKSLLDELFEHAPQAVVLLNVDNRVVRVNREFARVFGYSSQETLGRYLSQLIVPDELREEYQKYTDLVARGQRLEAEAVRQRKDGRRLDVSMVRVPVSVPGGQVTAYAMYRDITDRKRAEGQIHFQASLLDQVQNAVIAVDLEHNVVFWNSFAETLYQWKKEEAIGRNIFELIVPEAGRSAGEKILESLKKIGHWEGEFVIKRKDGSTFPAYVHNSAVRGKNSEIIGWVGVSTDITERIRLHQELQESEERFRLFMNHMPGYAWIKNAEGGYVYMNRRLQEVLPKHQDNWVGRSDREFWPLDIAAEFGKNDQRVLSDNQPLQAIESWVHDGKVHFLLVSKFPIRDSQGHPIMVAGTSIDITERKRAEEQLRATSEQLRALSASLRSAKEEEGTRIARELHDELGSALTRFKWDLEEIDKIVSDPGNQMNIATLRERIAGMTSLIDNTIHSLRRISSELRPSILDDLGLVAAIEWQAQQFESHTKIMCQCDAFVNKAALTKDQATALFRILQEAMTNILRHAQATRVNIALEEEDGEFVLRVRDNGRGMTEEERTGFQSLGLMGMRERAHLIGGKVEIAGVAGKGTVLTVRIPLTQVD